MEYDSLIGKLVWNRYRNSTGIILRIEQGYIYIDYHGEIASHSFPSSFADFLELEDEQLQEKIQEESSFDSFANFKNYYISAVEEEIDFLKLTGGKKYKIIDGELLSSVNGEYVYAFDTDIDMHFPDSTVIKILLSDEYILGNVISCEDFTIIIRVKEFLGEKISSLDFTINQWSLLEALNERVAEMEPSTNSIAYEVACCGKKQISRWNQIHCGQNAAFSRATSEKVTFIWGPPGTGKTETLANIALEHIKNGKRVLMVSYSNVSVDGALLRVATKADFPTGNIVRYGYPRTKELIDNHTLTTYRIVLKNNPEISAKYDDLIQQKNKLKKNDPARAEITKKINKIRENLASQEKKLVQQSTFVATTISKATVDSAIYSQKFDVVIFDEASMAYVPQVVFSAGLAKNHFICLGDFRQLPAIVQNNRSDRLTIDIFEHTGITGAIDNEKCHEWLIMLDLQYRMHNDISDFVSANMYHNRLKTSEKIFESRNEIAKCIPCSESAMSMVDLSEMYSVCKKNKRRLKVQYPFCLYVPSPCRKKYQ